MKRFLPYGKQEVTREDIDAVARVLSSDFLTAGPIVPEFEAAIAARLQARNVTVVNSGTAALHLAILAAQIGPGDAVIVPSISFLATANAVLQAGADVVFCDVDPLSGLMTAEHLEEALKHIPARLNARAVIPVAMSGFSPLTKDLMTVARTNGLVVIEDACHALGSELAVEGGTIPVGAAIFADFHVFSFHPVKSIAMGEGGAITTNDAVADSRIKQLRNHGMTRNPEDYLHVEMAFDNKENREPNPWYYEMQSLGWNYRAPDILCALGLSQFKRLDDIVKHRRQLVNLYKNHFSELESPLRVVSPEKSELACQHLLSCLIPFTQLGISRSQVITQLKDEGIGSQVHYIPIHRQPFYAQRYDSRALPGADHWYAEELSLPLFPQMEESDVRYVAERITEILSKSGKG